MKKHILIISMLATVTAGVFTGCTKKQFDDKYYDPEKATEATIDALYSGMFSNRRVFPDYQHYRTILGEITGRYTQSVGFRNGERRYEQNPNYVQDIWNDFYAAPGGGWTAPISSFREMEKIYNALEEGEEKQGYLVFMETARIFLFDQAIQEVDLFGDIPFSQSGKLNLEGALELASYDDATAVYDTVLTELKRISVLLSNAQIDPLYMSRLRKHDLMCGGDLLKWRRYANSLMLRMAMRISYVQEDKARTLVQEILANPSLYPLVEANTDNIELKIGPPSRIPQKMPESWSETNANLAPGYLVDSLMEPAGDPRLRLLYAPNRDGVYQGLPTSWTATEQDNAIGAGLISRMDTITFLQNQNLPGTVLMASEVHFAKAEAFERWGGGNPRNSYETGIRLSIDYYYDIHSRSKAQVLETRPTDAERTQMYLHPLVAYGSSADREGNLNKIALQKWIAFGPIHSTQTWAEMRRSGYPKITFPQDVSSAVAPLPPARFLYPSTERNLNSQNYAKVASKDTYNTPIFWAQP